MDYKHGKRRYHYYLKQLWRDGKGGHEVKAPTPTNKNQQCRRGEELFIHQRSKFKMGWEVTGLHGEKILTPPGSKLNRHALFVNFDNYNAFSCTLRAQFEGTNYFEELTKQIRMEVTPLALLQPSDSLSHFTTKMRAMHDKMK